MYARQASELENSDDKDVINQALVSLLSYQGFTIKLPLNCEWQITKKTMMIFSNQIAPHSHLIIRSEDLLFSPKISSGLRNGQSPMIDNHSQCSDQAHYVAV